MHGQKVGWGLGGVGHGVSFFVGTVLLSGKWNVLELGGGTIELPAQEQTG